MKLIAQIAVGVGAAAMLLTFFLPRLLGPNRERIDRPRTALHLLPFLTFPAFGVFAVLGILGIVGLTGTGAGLDALRALGLLLMLAGMAFTVWGRRSLGKQLVPDVAVVRGHELVRTRAYAVVRHPIYLGVLTLWLGAGIALLNVPFVLAFLVLAPIQAARARVEEELLVRHFGQAYREYQARVPMLLPIRRRRAG